MLAATVLMLAACGGDAPSRPTADPMNRIAESYVRLALALGEHDPSYVDAYYGPPEWREQAKARKLPLDSIRAGVEALEGEVARIPADSADSLVPLRHEYLAKRLRAMKGRLDFLDGKKAKFDDESAVLYDAVAPTLGEEHFKEVLSRLDRELPGKGPVPARFEAFRGKFAIPRARLDTVFRTAIAECRSRTARHIELPPARASRWNT